MMMFRVPVHGPGHERVLSRLAHAASGIAYSRSLTESSPGSAATRARRQAPNASFGSLVSPPCDAARPEHLDSRRYDCPAGLLCGSLCAHDRPLHTFM